MSQKKHYAERQNVMEKKKDDGRKAPKHPVTGKKEKEVVCKKFEEKKAYRKRAKRTKIFKEMRAKMFKKSDFSVTATNETT